MKAAIVESPGKLVVRDVPDPEPGDYDVLCDLLYGATCTGTDSHIIAGVFPFSSPFPTILGHESVGRVIKKGRKVRNFQLGDLVTRVGAVPPPGAEYTVSWGGFAERGLAKDHWAMAQDVRPESEWAGNRVNQIVPAAIDPRVAPMFTTWRETLSYVTRMGFCCGSRVLVVGSGGNGLAFARHAVNRGAANVAMVGAARTEQIAHKLGVNIFVDYHAGDVAAALANACPDGFDFIVDAVGRKGAADAVLPCLAPGGRLGIYGMDDFGSVTLNPDRARGSFEYWRGGYDEAETHQEVSELVLQGKLDASLWYDLHAPFPLTDINAAFEAVQNRTSIKALVQLKPE